jgi:electron transport complex protein RnfG
MFLGFPWTLMYRPVADTPCAKRARRILVLLMVLMACSVSKHRHVMAQVLLTQDEALALAFPNATSFDRITAFLDNQQAEQIGQLAGTPPDRLTITHYIAMQGNDRIGVGYFDAHLVRTLNEVLLVAIGLEEEIITIEVVAFAEPPEYRAPDRWLELFDGKSWEDDLSMKGEIPNLTGATLTTRALKRTVERILALHRVLNPLKEFIR